MRHAKSEQRDVLGRIVRDSRGPRNYTEAESAVLKATHTPSLAAASGAREAMTASVVTPSGLTIEHQWSKAVFGVGIGDTGLVAADIDADGSVEVVAAAGKSGFWANSYWYVLSRSGTGYVQEWSSPMYASDITSLRVAQLDWDPALEVVIATAGEIQVLDGATREFEHGIYTPVSTIHALNVADVDADGFQEFVFTDGYTLHVIDALSGVQELQAWDLGGEDIAVGQLDADAALELVVANGESTGSVLDGLTYSVEWSQASGFGSRVRIADLDRDGHNEVIAAFEWTRGLEVYRGSTRALMYSVPVSTLAAVRVADVEADGTLELVYGDAQWGRIHVLTGTTGVEKWSVSNPEHGVTDLAVANVDADASQEILWGAGYTSSGADYLYVVDAARRTQEWRSLDESGPFYAQASADVDGDGQRELLTGSFTSDSGYGDGLYSFHDAATGAVEYVSGPLTGTNWTGLWRIRSANVDEDAQQEVFVTTSQVYRGLIIARDGLTHAEQWRASVPDGFSLRGLQLANLDDDGPLEVVSSTGTESSGAPAPTVFVHEATTGELLWQGPPLGSPGFASLSLLRVANVDLDPMPEIIVAAMEGGLWVIDADSRSVQAVSASLGITALDTADVDGDFRADIVVGTADGQILRIDPVTGDVTHWLAYTAGQVNGLAVVDVTGDGTRDYVFASFNQLRILDGVTGMEEWASEVLGEDVGAHDSVRVEDVDGDGLLEAVVNTGPVGFTVYELRPVVQETPGVARYDAAFRAPRCSTVAASCDSGTLLVGRGPLGPESNAPNTVFDSCADGQYGGFHQDESNDRIRVSTLDGTPMAPGKTVLIEATVWAWMSPLYDRLDLYAAADANAPDWQHVATLTPSIPGEQVLSATYVLPDGPVQAVRARFYYGSESSSCRADSFNDHDDLVFAVQ